MSIPATASLHRVVIVGGGFGGLYAAKEFGRLPVQVTLVDRRNFHLFQPLLYQVATGTLSPADISSPLRGVLSHQSNTMVLMDEVVDVDPAQQTITLTGQTLSYDTLIIATGVSHHYFGNDQWKTVAPGLKTVEDALDIRRRIFMAFEAAEKELDPARRQAWLTFVVVGGGPTGVELAGAIAELAFNTLKRDFRNIDTTEASVILLEGMERILPPYSPELSAKAAASLTALGVTIQTKTLVTNIEANIVTARQGDDVQQIPAQTILWAAGVKASGLGQVLADRAGVTLDRVGRVMVEADLSLPGHANIFVIGDLAHYAHQGEKPLPGVAPVAMQEGQFVARLVAARLYNQTLPTFTYQDAGSLAVIGQNRAVADLNFVKLSGPLAWFVWVFAHIFYLIEFDNKLIVMLQWGWNYFTRSRGARLITGEASLLQVRMDAQGELQIAGDRSSPAKV
ncbi:MAG: NAD(P)/FAD-dependent oxidoreductase [Leptolyngbyaceae cyanobacterium bins.349]|nr:NAD(P)/FAD-dependent oxidoreductase [Leptolyngbyaceae cyanobacterium bins.349]